MLYPCCQTQLRRSVEMRAGGKLRRSNCLWADLCLNATLADVCLVPIFP